MSRFNTRSLLLFAVLIAVLSGFAGVAAQEEKVLVVGQAELTDSLDPARAYSTTAFIIHKATYQTLVTFPASSTDKIEPLLAKSWTASDDQTVYTFTLRDDVTFANGDPLTASDVVFSFNRFKNIKGNPSFLAETIASVEAPDPHTVVLKLTQPDPAILARLVGTEFSVTSAKEVKAQGGTDAADAGKSDKAEKWLNGHSAGTGPYVLDSWMPHDQTVLVRNPNYWGTAPYFDRIVIKDIPEAATQAVAVKSGDVDLALDLTPDQLSSLEGSADVKIYRAPTVNLHFLLLNNDPNVGGPLANPKVQQAIREALDYPGYTHIWGGVNPPSIIPVGFLGAYGPDRAPKRDVEAAKQLLKDAGYSDGFETTLTYPLWTYAGVTWDTNAQKIQADLGEIGITVKLNPKDINGALEDYRSGKQAFGLWFWTPDFIDPSNQLVFLPDQTLGKRANWTAENADPAIVRLRDEALVETDPVKRVDLFHQIQDYLQQNGPWVPFLQNGIQVAYRADIEGTVYHPQWILDVTQLSRTS